MNADASQLDIISPTHTFPIWHLNRGGIGYRNLLIGLLFGSGLVIGAWICDAWLRGLSFSWGAIQTIHQQNPIHYLIDTAPLLMALVSILIGIQFHRNSMRIYNLSELYQSLGRSNKKVKDSISYSRHIQQSIIPDSAVLQQHFPQSFLFYRPKDEVSGDFPWFYQQGQYLYVAAVDCTGHGVPGAMMSLTTFFILNEIMAKRVGPTPAAILHELDERLRLTLGQNKSRSNTNTDIAYTDIRDGADIALCRFDLNQQALVFSGAHCPFSYIRKGALTTIKGDRMGVGGRYIHQSTFTDREISLEAGDLVFLYSDGLPDQHGGPRQKKFTRNRMRQLLLELSETPFKHRENIIAKGIGAWQGDVSQTDDMLLLGIAIDPQPAVPQHQQAEVTATTF